MSLPDDGTIIETLLTYIREELLYENEDVTLAADTELVKEGLLTSLGILRLLGFLEERFGVRLQASEVQIEDFLTAVTIRDLVKRHGA
jgi:acyl carrier protein